MFAARETSMWVSDAYRAESDAGPLPLPTAHENTMSGGWEGERAGADFAYEPRRLATTTSER